MRCCVLRTMAEVQRENMPGAGDSGQRLRNREGVVVDDADFASVSWSLTASAGAEAGDPLGSLTVCGGWRLRTGLSVFFAALLASALSVSSGGFSESTRSSPPGNFADDPVTVAFSSSNEAHPASPRLTDKASTISHTGAQNALKLRICLAFGNGSFDHKLVRETLPTYARPVPVFRC